MVNPPNYKHSDIKLFVLSSPSSLNKHKYYTMRTALRGGLCLR